VATNPNQHRRNVNLLLGYIITSGYPACATMLKKEIHFVYYMWIDNF